MTINRFTVCRPCCLPGEEPPAACDICLPGTTPREWVATIPAVKGNGDCGHCDQFVGDNVLTLGDFATPPGYCYWQYKVPRYCAEVYGTPDPPWPDPTLFDAVSLQLLTINQVVNWAVGYAIHYWQPADPPLVPNGYWRSDAARWLRPYTQGGEDCNVTDLPLQFDPPTFPPDNNFCGPISLPVDDALITAVY